MYIQLLTSLLKGDTAKPPDPGKQLGGDLPMAGCIKIRATALQCL
jgi:hypothetical protein